MDYRHVYRSGDMFWVGKSHVAQQNQSMVLSPNEYNHKAAPHPLRASSIIGLCYKCGEGNFCIVGCLCIIHETKSMVSVHGQQCSFITLDLFLILNTLKQKVEEQRRQNFKSAKTQRLSCLLSHLQFLFLYIKKEELSCKSNITAVPRISQLVDSFHENAQIFCHRTLEPQYKSE